MSRGTSGGEYGYRVPQIWTLTSQYNTRKEKATTTKNLTVSHSSPLYDGDGYVTGTDSAGSLVADLRAFLDECAAHNILAGLVFFNGAVLLDHNL